MKLLIPCLLAMSTFGQTTATPTGQTTLAPTAANISGALLCPVCQKRHVESRVYPGMCSSTLAYCQSFYDEKGEYHDNSGCNTTTCWYSCSRGHEFYKMFGGGKPEQGPFITNDKDSKPELIKAPGIGSTGTSGTITIGPDQIPQGLEPIPRCEVDSYGMYKDMRKLKILVEKHGTPYSDWWNAFLDRFLKNWHCEEPKTK